MAPVAAAPPPDLVFLILNGEDILELELLEDTSTYFVHYLIFVNHGQIVFQVVLLLNFLSVMLFIVFAQGTIYEVAFFTNFTNKIATHIGLYKHVTCLEKGMSRRTIDNGYVANFTPICLPISSTPWIDFIRRVRLLTTVYFLSLLSFVLQLQIMQGTGHLMGHVTVEPT